jgi:hypothetical protein
MGSYPVFRQSTLLLIDAANGTHGALNNSCFITLVPTNAAQKEKQIYHYTKFITAQIYSSARSKSSSHPLAIT